MAAILLHSIGKEGYSLEKKDISEYVGIETALCLLVSIGAYIFFGSREEVYFVAYLPALYFYVKFLVTEQNHLDKELKMHYYYLIPDSSVRKLIAITRVDIIRFSANILALMLPYSLLLGIFKLELLLIPPVSLLLYSASLLSSYLLNMFYPSKDFKHLTFLIKLIQTVLVLLPSIIISVVIAYQTESLAFVLISNIIANAGICLVILAFSDFLFSRLELKS